MAKMANWRKAKGRPWDIYMITNLKNGKVYIGQTKQRLQTRFSQHMTPTSACKGLRAAVKKHGRNSFQIMKLTTAKTQKQADSLEKLWIWLTRSDNPKYGYNRTRGGSGNGIAFNSDIRQSMSEQRKGKGNSFYGKHHTKDAKDRMSAAHIGKECPWKRKRVICTDTGEEYESIKEAAEAKGVNASKIGDVCRGARKSTGGTHWRYA